MRSRVLTRRWAFQKCQETKETALLCLQLPNHFLSTNNFGVRNTAFQKDLFCKRYLWRHYECEVNTFLLFTQMTKHSCPGCTQSRGNGWKENFLLSTFLLSPSECSLETSETSFLRADFPLFQRRGNRGLLTYKAQCFGTSVILLSPCQSDGASLQQTTGQWGWTLRLFHPYELTRIGLKSSLEKKQKSLLQLALQTVGKHRWRGWQEKQLLLLGFLSVWILRRRTRNSITDWNAI